MSATALSAEPAPAKARPFLKWVGGKRSLVTRLREHLPAHVRRYYEPFVGGGALFFSLAQEGPGSTLGTARPTLSDRNERLIRTYRAVRDQVDPLVECLQDHASHHSKEFFLELRDREIDRETDDVAVAAWLIYLNRTAFNGLYRVNSKGRFNVPFGRYVRPRICDEDNLRACSRILQGVELRVAAYDEATEGARARDLVYFDPPYVPVSTTSSFTSYTRDGFTLDDQVGLRDLALELKDRGVHVVLSNSDTPTVRELYDQGFQWRPVAVKRAINSVGSQRGPVGELIIW
ncbi:MAG: DNA adenine methylase [Myxococcota bacterium]|nr:DNA adenine methylase [Myxococcota bacterium]